MWNRSWRAVAKSIGAAAVLGIIVAGRAPSAQSAPPEVKMGPKRAMDLHVSNDPNDNSLGHDFQRDIDRKADAPSTRHP
jgi:hypothetical protein